MCKHGVLKVILRSRFTSLSKWTSNNNFFLIHWLKCKIWTSILMKYFYSLINSLVIKFFATIHDIFIDIFFIFEPIKWVRNLVSLHLKPRIYKNLRNRKLFTFKMLNLQILRLVKDRFFMWLKNKTSFLGDSSKLHSKTIALFNMNIHPTYWFKEDLS